MKTRKLTREQKDECLRNGIIQGLVIMAVTAILALHISPIFYLENIESYFTKKVLVGELLPGILITALIAFVIFFFVGYLDEKCDIQKTK